MAGNKLLNTGFAVDSAIGPIYRLVGGFQLAFYP